MMKNTSPSLHDAIQALVDQHGFDAVLDALDDTREGRAVIDARNTALLKVLKNHDAAGGMRGWYGVDVD